MAYDVTWGKNRSLFTFHDEIDIDEVNEANGVLHGSKIYQNYHCSVWDFLNCDTSKIKRDEVKEPAYVGKAATLSVKHVKKALVAKDDYTLELCHEFAALFKMLEASAEVCIFDSMDAAQQWCHPQEK